ncbi:unnamed protein product [Closterium sp. NIES-54]
MNPERVSLTFKDIGKAAAAIMRGDKLGTKGLEAAYGLPEGEDLPAVWSRLFDDLQPLLLDKSPPEPPACSPFTTMPEEMNKALEEELVSFRNCLRSFSKATNGLRELQQQFRKGEVSHALRITAPKLHLSDPVLQEQLNHALEEEVKTFKTRTQATLMAYKEKEKALWEKTAGLWEARAHTGFESFLEKILEAFERRTAAGTPVADDYLTDLATDYLARGMARELMYHAVWVRGNRGTRARIAAKREKAQAEQARLEDIQADPSTNLLELVKAVVGKDLGSLQQRVKALEQRQPGAGGEADTGQWPATEGVKQRRREARKKRALNRTANEQPNDTRTEAAEDDVGQAGARVEVEGIAARVAAAVPSTAEPAKGLRKDGRHAGEKTRAVATLAAVATIATGSEATAAAAQATAGTRAPAIANAPAAAIPTGTKGAAQRVGRSWGNDQDDNYLVADDEHVDKEDGVGTGTPWSGDVR